MEDHMTDRQTRPPVHRAPQLPASQPRPNISVREASDGYDRTFPGLIDAMG